MYILNILISSIIIILGIIVGTQNGNTYVDINLLWFNFNNISLSLIMLESLVFGMLIILVVAGFYEIIQRTKFFKAKKRIEELENELSKVRELVADSVESENKGSENSNKDNSEEKSEN